MRSLIGVAEDQARDLARRIAISATLAVVAIVLSLFAASALLAGLFLSLAAHSVVVAALLVALFAFALTLIAAFPVWLTNRRQPRQVGRSALGAATFASAIPHVAAVLGPRRLLIGTLVVALAIVLASTPSSGERSLPA